MTYNIFKQKEFSLNHFVGNRIIDKNNIHNYQLTIGDKYIQMNLEDLTRLYLSIRSELRINGGL